MSDQDTDDTNGTDSTREIRRDSGYFYLTVGVNRDYEGVTAFNRTIDYGNHSNLFTFDIDTRYGVRNVIIEKTHENLIITTNSTQLREQIISGTCIALKKDEPNIFALVNRNAISILFKNKKKQKMQIYISLI